MFFTFPSSILHAVDLLERLDHHLQRGIDRLRRRRPVDPCLEASARVHRVDDPDHTTRIVRVVGTVTPSVLPCVLRAWEDLTSPQLIHIDLTDAEITDLATMLAFERAIDHLERQEIGIRIVGLDPTHPALTV